MRWFEPHNRRQAEELVETILSLDGDGNANNRRLYSRQLRRPEGGCVEYKYLGIAIYSFLFRPPQNSQPA